ncbi:MAG: OmpA family protein [Bacteroidetes bacterium]|nr:OmpA family protein [Bacteroidota bacterium]
MSEARSKAAYDYLVTKGISASRMKSAGYGATKPIADNKTAEGRAQNRRTEFNLYIPN